MFCLTLLSALIALVHARTAVYPPISNLDGRIVGGKSVSIEEYPYQLSLELTGRHMCGASLIAPNVALTAAHCTNGRSVSDFRVRAGSSTPGNGGELADVISVCMHPKFYPYDYDVAVLHLNRSLPLGASIQTISLQPVGKEIRDGTLAAVTGWGRLSPGGQSPTTLQAVEVPKVNQSSCKTFYYQNDITNRMTCYGYTEGGKDACQGDSGGPLVIDGKLVGVVSWGIGCAYPNYPGIYAKVSDKDNSDHINNCLAKFKL